ncbi:NUDIX hydrolase [Streptomyces formicae]|uniref:NUDIX hydrolase n=1 Tax=Streptomyces formicae TaxID=1616117 RepID=A0ABY3WWQ2_9ACTN|nr:NUDIX hydrolase [Streptomyces formicae]UNM15986.1 NUDIX hydrolase [Streptomyces formicae]
MSTPGTPPGTPRSPGSPGTPEAGTVRAAGCVLWRRAPQSDDGIEICLVHRPRYDDWSHPKGKLKRSEDVLAGALREVLEETGHHATPGPRLPTVHYVANGRPKEVSYWAAEAETRGEFIPGREVDRIDWLPPTAARARLTQPRDRHLVDVLVSELGILGSPGAH